MKACTPGTLLDDNDTFADTLLHGVADGLARMVSGQIVLNGTAAQTLAAGLRVLGQQLDYGDGGRFGPHITPRTRRVSQPPGYRVEIEPTLVDVVTSRGVV